MTWKATWIVLLCCWSAVFILVGCGFAEEWWPGQDQDETATTAPPESEAPPKEEKTSSAGDTAADTIDGILSIAGSILGGAGVGALVGRLKPARIIKNMIDGTQEVRKLVKVNAGKRKKNLLALVDAKLHEIQSESTKTRVRRVKKKTKMLSVSKMPEDGS